MADSNDNLPVFTVPRSKWYRGKGGNGSSLLREDGRRCCLGHVAQQCGVSDEHVRLIGDPETAAHNHRSDREHWPPGLLNWFTIGPSNQVRNSTACGDMIGINDDPEMHDAQREVLLQDLALKAGFRLVFVDDEVTNG